MSLTNVQIANIIFNETRSLSGADIATARLNIAWAIKNAIASPHRLPSMASTHVRVPAVEQAAYEACVAAVTSASLGIDPTAGATHFNFRSGASRANFQGHSIKTQAGPLANSYPTTVLPASGIYANTYE